MSIVPRIAFATDPFPVRSGSKDFEWPFVRFCTVADALHRSGAAITYIIATDDLIDKYKYSNNSIKGSDLGFSQEWPNKWRTDWVSFLEGRDKNLTSEISKIFSREKIEILFIWNKNDTIRQAAVSAGVQVVHVELGPIRSPKAMSWIFDPRGIGPDSLLSQLVMCKNSKKFRDNKYLFKLVDLSGSRDVIPKTPCAKKRVLFPLQVENDVNNILWNPWTNQTNSTPEIIEWFSQYEDIELTVRQHPAANKSDILEISNRYPFVKYDSGESPIWDSLPDWDGIIHINSTLGFEASLFGVPVCTLGASAFSEKITPDVATRKMREFIETIRKDNLNRKIDEKTVRIFNILESMFLVDDRLSVKPSFYLKIASALRGFSGGAEKWFESYGLRKIIEYLRLEGLDGDLSSLRAENHRRIMSINDISFGQSGLKTSVDALLHHNHLRSEEILAIRKKIE